MNPPGERPLLVTILGILYIGIGGLLGLSAVFGLAMQGLVALGNADLFSISSQPFLYPGLEFQLKWGWALQPLWIALGVFVAIAGWKLLALKAWARKALETTTWCYVVFLVGSGAVLTWALSQATLNPAYKDRTLDPEMLNLLKIGMAIGAAAVNGVFAVIGLVLGLMLRHSSIRRAVADAAAQGAAEQALLNPPTDSAGAATK